MHRPALRHGIAGVGREVHENLLDLHRIQTNSAQSLAGDKDELDVFSDKAVQGLDDSS